MFAPRGRVPVVLQMSYIECGAACLAMILGYYGRKTRLSECRDLLGTGRDGISAYEIVEAGSALGLEMEGFAVAAADIAEVPLPAIAFWEDNHFVIIERITRSAIHLVDPALGRTHLDPHEFAHHFSGTVLTATPGAGFVTRPRTDNSGWAVYWQGLWQAPGAKKLLGQIVLASLSLQLLGLTLPLVTKWLVDDVLGQQLNEPLRLVGLGLLILLLIQFLLSYTRERWLIVLQAQFDTRMMVDFFAHVLTLPADFFLKRTSGDMLQRLGSNMTIREAFTNNILSTVLDGTLVVIYWLILLYVSPLFAGLALLLGMGQIAVLLLTTPSMRFLTERVLVNESRSHSYLLEALAGVVTVKAAAAEGRVFHHWYHLFEDHLQGLIRQSALSAKINTFLQSLRLFSPLLLLWLGVSLVLQERLTVGTMLALNSLALAFLTPLTTLVQNGQQLQYVGAHLERVMDVMLTAPEQDASNKKEVAPLSGRLSFVDVSFRYDPHSTLVLENISFTVEPGQRIAIVGPTGSGKSTLALLLLGLYAPTTGTILYDDQPLAELDLPGLRRQWGVVLQQATLFHGSIRENMTLNDHEVPINQIEAAAHLAHIHHDIEQMPMGYETLVAEAGGGLSGGQRQRILLARALLHSPRLLLLDEATSHLDGATEQQVVTNLNGLACTQIIIAHRLSTFRSADLILVINEGKIVERGRHDDLLTQGGIYSALVAGQLAEAEREMGIPAEP